MKTKPKTNSNEMAPNGLDHLKSGAPSMVANLGATAAHCEGLCKKKVKISTAFVFNGLNTLSARYELRMIPNNNEGGDWFNSPAIIGL